MPVNVELSGDVFATLQNEHGGTAREAIEDAALLYVALENPEEMLKDVEHHTEITDETGNLPE
ncbi:hypothetical protein [Halorhabdus amylolytica]|uniref:hypothetical protein n=1 Tax=Halorhabdus amylolytica TaxID=2559573 RepID=UPI0010AAD2F8|nr:hypothetical protein [Halorhabdus amylolytica]